MDQSLRRAFSSTTFIAALFAFPTAVISYIYVAIILNYLVFAGINVIFIYTSVYRLCQIKSICIEGSVLAWVHLILDVITISSGCAAIMIALFIGPDHAGIDT